MATWPASGDTDWNTKMLAFLAVSFNTDGTPKASVFGFSAYTNQDSESNAMLKAHAYLAATAGFVSAKSNQTNNAQPLKGYVGLTNDPAGAGTEIQSSADGDSGSEKSVFFAVAAGEYFEITQTTDTPVILWKSIGTLSKPVDQD